MYAVEKLSSYITRGVYTVSGPFHPFGGAVDIIVVQQQDGSFKSSPWYVRFGKFQGVLKTREKVVTICVNGVEAGFHMYLDHKGEAYFLKDSDSGEGVDFEISPPSSGDEMDEKIRSSRFKKDYSCNYDGGQGEPIAPLENGNVKIMSRSSSRRSRIFGLMFGNKPMKGNGRGSNVERVSSLERAEIAADLLETKWLTNLSPKEHRTDIPMENGDFDVTIIKNEVVSSHEEGVGDNFGTSIVSREHFDKVAIHNSLNPTNYTGDDPNPCLGTGDSVKESVHSYGEKLGESFRPNVVREVHFEETITQTSTSRTHEEVLEVYTLETGDSGDRSKLISESVMIESDEYNISSKASVLDNFTDNAQIPTPMEDELPALESPEEKYDEEKDASSLSYTETLQTSTVTFDVSVQPPDTLSLSSGGDKSLQEHICEATSRPESEKSIDTENCGGCHNQDLELSRVEVSSVFQDFQSHSPSNVPFQDTSGNVSNADSPQKLSSSESEVIYEDRETSELSQGKLCRIEELDFIQTRCPVLEEEPSAPNYHVPEPDDISFISNEGQESKTFGNCVSGEKPYLQSRLKSAQDESKFSLSESLEDEQFQFSDLDSFSVKQINSEVQVSNTAAEMDDNMLFKVEGDIEEEQYSEDTNHEECFERDFEVSGSQTSPLAIPRSMTQLGETELSAKSLPIIRSQIHDVGRSNILHTLSCSLDLNSDSFKHDLLKKEISNSSKLELDSGHDMIRDNCASQAPAISVDSENKQGHTIFPINSSVELSLCKHLLFEGMGADAASRVFETNKVNLEKFSTSGPSLLKNEKLVVRIGGRYFPWHAAAPIILGMLCFGQEQMFESQGMINVDKDEKSGDPSIAITPSGGSWRLWPFSLKKSKTISTVLSVSESITRENVDASSMRSQRLMGHDHIQKTKFTKKVQSLTPTSEELASLNLKEGQNVITFSFSTAMLGKQQVDARIYLWKWNTRIVISDVDGTITKSDVLGQFMPLVGKDWSQTGVTHLFSAIKENGYQFLFLSARAISQAYLTRQFLFNLKQDGKTLPDGPVVISPDGLFPSLYREVIRRAPHEFKISCLEDIRVLFPPECNPFYAGFGNRDTDEISYLKVGIPKGKIFIINPKGEVAVNRRVDTKSYTSLHALVNGMFPPMSTAEQEDFNSWNYWRLPLPDVDI